MVVVLIIVISGDSVLLHPIMMEISFILVIMGLRGTAMEYMTSVSIHMVFNC